MTLSARQRYHHLPRLVLENTIVGTLAGGIAGLLIRIYLAHFQILNMDWSILVFTGMAIGFFSGFERIRFERIRREKKNLEIRLLEKDQALQETKDRHESILARTPDWIFQSDREFRMVESNKTLEEIFGYRGEMTERETFFHLLPPQLRTEFERNFKEVLDGTSKLVEIETKNARGNHLYFYLVLYPTRDVNKEIIGVAGIMRNISERKKLEKELLQAEKMAEIGTMAASVAHEIRNPLGIIRTAIFNLNHRLPEKDNLVKKHVANIEQKVEEANTIITSLLNYSRLREPVLMETDINKLLEESLEQVAEQFPGGNIQVLKKWGNIPSIKVDRVHLSEVFYNMIKNAYEAMDNSGKLTLATSYIQSREILEISISDTGCGIAPENREKIGKPFFSTKARGVGLGLSLSYRIVKEVHGGTVDVESKEGQDTVFTIKLPANR